MMICESMQHNSDLRNICMFVKLRYLTLVGINLFYCCDLGKSSFQLKKTLIFFSEI